MKLILPFFIGLMDHLAAAGLQCPVPIKDKDGTVLQSCAGRPAAIVSFLDGTSQKFQPQRNVPNWGARWPIFTWILLISA